MLLAKAVEQFYQQQVAVIGRCPECGGNIDALETRREQAEQAGQMEAASAFQYAVDLLRTVG